MPSEAGVAYSVGYITVGSGKRGGVAIVTKPGGFGVVTAKHARIEFKFLTTTTAGATLVNARDGGLDVRTATGRVVAHISAARAIDSTGKSVPASYQYDGRSHELVVKADTTQATGLVFIDPSWGCYASLAGYGLMWLAVVAGWLFGWSFPGMDWALVTWFRIAPSVADRVARSCAARR
jgi:hypothetical protein